ncbi:MAG TPA: NAD-dependent epimerase/dehydratase family protein [Burkholderiales bacterium]
MASHLIRMPRLIEMHQKPVVLVTGLGGRIGSAIAQALGETYTLVGFELRCGEDDPQCIETDITSDEALERACGTLRARHGSRLAAVIHLAAFYDFSGRENPKYEEVNVRGTERLLRALQSFEVERFVYASTMLVHAPGAPGRPIDEDSALEPKWPYPRSKLAAERAVMARRGSIPVALLRIAGVYTDDCEVPSLAYQAARIYERSLESRVFPGDPSHGQAFLHIDDLAQAFRAVVERRASLPESTVLLLGEPETLSYAELQQRIGELVHGEHWPTRSIPESMAKTGAWLQQKAEDIVPDFIDRGIEPFIQPFMIPLADDHYEVDISRARALLGWEPRRRLRTALPAMVARLKERPAAWYRQNKVPLPVWLEQAAAVEQPAGRLVQRAWDQVEERFRRTLWCHFANASLGLWLLFSPQAFGIADARLYWSDVLTGIAIFVLAMLSLSRQAGWARWTLAALGTWLLLAPLVFWTTSAAAYRNDTLVGALVILFAVAIPPPPGVSPVAAAAGPDMPPGWSFNPSSWTQRIPVVALAFVGLFFSLYLAAFQLGHIEQVWDPFFGRGTEQVITSEVSEAFPVPDAGLGAVVYMLEILTGVIGDRRRWRTMPWLTLAFGVMIVPLGAVSIVFIIIQPIVIGTWCALCLLGAAAMLVQIPYALDELLATVQFLRNRAAAGASLWHVFWRGDTVEGGREEVESFERPALEVLRDMVSGGVNLPWNLAATLAIGAALMFSRVLFGATAEAADNDHLIGALVVTVAGIALAEMARPLRYVNVAFGAWLVAAPWLLDGYTARGTAASVVAGLLLVALAVPRGAIRQHYGAWDRLIRRTAA